MYIQVVRESDNGKSTIGRMYVNGVFQCYTLEDTYNFPKVYGETRIPSGTYEIKLRNAGSMTGKYAERYDFHKGMLWLQDVKDFKWVYIHTGNTHEHTDGCILVGDSADIKSGTIGQSRLAYAPLYVDIVAAMERGEEVTIEVV